MKADAQGHEHSRWGLMAVGAAFGWLIHKAFSQKVAVPDAPGIAAPAPPLQRAVGRPQEEDEPIPVSGSEFPEGPSADHVEMGTILVVAAFAIGIGAAIGFLFAYWTGNNNLLLGGTMALAFGGVGTALVLWARWLIPHPEVTASREVLPSSSDERQAVLDDFCKGENRIQRRHLLTSLSTAFLGVMAAVMVSLFRSFGKPPGPALMGTVWKSGQRLLTMHGDPVSVGTLEAGSSMIVFPEESIGSVLTSAYRNNDLHTLLRLELEWIQREEGDVERLTEEKLSIYNQVLKEQVSELERELTELPYHPRYQPITVSAGPLGIRLRTENPEELRWLDRTIASMEASIARIRSGEPLDEVRDVIKAYRASTRGQY